MVVVAALTSSLRGWNMTVKTGAAGELWLELGMAGEALVRGDLLAFSVAPGTVVQAFQIGVGLGQRTRREQVCLRKTREEHERQRQARACGFGERFNHEAFAAKIQR